VPADGIRDLSIFAGMADKDLNGHKAAGTFKPDSPVDNGRKYNSCKD
jgi:hypothetical protein